MGLNDRRIQSLVWLAMPLGIDYGLEHLDVEIRDTHMLHLRRAPARPPVADPAAAVASALEQPARFPPLRRALTPDDHVAIVIDERLPHLSGMLLPVLDHLAGAHVAPEAITLLCPPSTCEHRWTEDLPAAFRSVRVERHNPADRKRLSYLATTAQGRRLYLNRTVVDADQVVVLARRGYDPLLGYSGCEGALYPSLSDEQTRQEMCGRLSLAVPGERPWPARQEATEVAWLLGAPFMIQVIEGWGDEVAHVVAGLADSSAEGQRLLDARWRVGVGQRADTVIASLGGDPARHEFADLARAAACAGRVVKPDGRIVLLSDAAPELGVGAELVRQAADPSQALSLLRKHTPADMASAFEWASTVQHAHVYVLSKLPGDIIEDLFATPVEDDRQVQRLVAAEGSCLVLTDAHKTMAVLDHDPVAEMDRFFMLSHPRERR